MGRAIAALLAAALVYPLTIIALGLHTALGGALRVGILLSAAVLFVVIKMVRVGDAVLVEEHSGRRFGGAGIGFHG